MVLGGHECEALAIEISTLIKRDLRELVHLFHHKGLQLKDAICEPERLLPDTEYACTLILDFLVSRTMKNTFSVVTVHPIHGILLAALID